MVLPSGGGGALPYHPPVKPPSAALGLLAALLASCAAPPPSPPPPDEESMPPLNFALDLRTPAMRAREAVSEVMGRPVPAEAANPVIATRAEMEQALMEELRPQVDMLHPGASQAARDTLLRSTAQRSARSVIARYSPDRKRILFPPENLLPQMAALGLPTDRSTVREFATLVLAHEMVHALDDEAHGLGTLFRSAPDAEALRALGMVVEGRAVHYARRAASLLGIDESIASILPAEKGELTDYRARFLLTYREGAAFAAALEARGIDGLAERVLEDPPRRTSTVFHPERYGPSGEAAAPDLAAALRDAGFAGAEPASELDLRARWLPVLGEEETARAFAGWVAGAGLAGPEGSLSVSLDETPAGALAWAAGLRRLHGMEPGASEWHGGDAGSVVILVEGRSTASATGPDPAAARAVAGRALAAAGK